jgi:hypothetical protein
VVHADYSAVIFDFERDIFRRKKVIEDVEDGSQTISGLPAFFLFS